jgi:hypothetical protein
LRVPTNADAERPVIAIDQHQQAIITGYVQRKRSRLIELTQDLIRLPSENKPPVGAERACQEHIARVLRASGWEPELYEMA